MILLNQHTENTVVLTLEEKRTTEDPDFVFEFTNDFTGRSVVFFAPDTSTWPSRYNRFAVTLVETPEEASPWTGHIYMAEPGYWTYRVHEMLPVSPVQLDTAESVNVVETGKVLLVAPDCVVPSYDPADATVPSYDPGCAGD